MQRTSTEFGFKCRSDGSFTQHIGDTVIDSTSNGASASKDGGIRWRFSGDIIGPALT